MAPTAPGVSIVEVAPTVHTITGVPTSIAAFIDYFARGPMNEAVMILGTRDFERTFAGLDPKSEASYGIYQFFLNGGAQAYVIRVAAGSPAKATIIAQDAAGGNNVLTVNAASEGSWGNNLRASVDYADAPAGAFNLTVMEVSPQNGRWVVANQESFMALTMNATDPTYVRAVVNASSQLVTVDDPPQNSARPAQSGLVSTAAFPAAVHTNPNPGQPMNIQVSLATASPADNHANVVVSLGTENVTSINDLAHRLQSAVRGQLPAAPGWAQALTRVVGDRVQLVAGPTAPDGIWTIANDGADQTATALNLVGAGNVSAYQLGSTGARAAQAAGQRGDDGSVPGGAQLMGNQGAVPPTGMYALDKVPIFNTLCIPRLGQLTGVNAIAQNDVDAVVAAATTYCRDRRAFFILDTPNTITNIQQMQAWAQSTAYRDDHLAIYFPRVMVPDPLSRFRLRDFGASGTMAGLYARFDDNPGVFRAAAGTDAPLRGVSKLQYRMSDAENGILNPLGVNCLRTFDVFGNLSWGARTLEGADQLASPWKYLAVRRVANFIEETLYEQTKWVIFQPNDEPLWAQIRLNVGAFMNNLFRKGYFQGQSARDAYFVKCDKETTTQNDIDLGVVNLVVGFAPLKPAEFLIIKIQQIAGQLQT